MTHAPKIVLVFIKLDPVSLFAGLQLPLQFEDIGLEIHVGFCEFYDLLLGLDHRLQRVLQVLVHVLPVLDLLLKSAHLLLGVLDVGLPVGRQEQGVFQEFLERGQSQLEHGVK